MKRCLPLALLVAAPLLTGCQDPTGAAAPVGGQLRLGAVLGGTDLAGYARAEAPRQFVFPADHGPHPAFRSEWWYLTAALEDEEGAPLGMQFTLFRQSLAPGLADDFNSWRTNQAYLAHLAVTDVLGDLHLTAERFARGHPELAGVTAAPFRLWIEDWQLEAAGELWHLKATGPAKRVHLTLDMTVPIYPQGTAAEPGLSRKGPDQASFYYSVPGIPVQGEIELEGRLRRVRGLGWLDREWSSSVLGPEQIGWDWFALHLDDGRRIMMFRLRRRDGIRDPYDQGLLVEASGTARPLAAADFSLAPQRWWQDRDGTRWPVGWRVQVGSETWQVSAMLDDQRMATAVNYWEGLVAVYDAGRPIGRGYLELTGYQRQAGRGD